MLGERDGLPFTARIGWGWYLGLIALSFGWAAVALGLYVSFWIRAKRGCGLAVYVFALVAVIMAAAWVPARWLPAFLPWGAIATVATVLWIAGAFLLGGEVRRYFADSEGVHLGMNPIWVALFSVVYINWCISLAAPVKTAASS